MKSKSMKFYIDMEILLKKIIRQEVNSQYYRFDFIDISYFRFRFQLATSVFNNIGLFGWQGRMFFTSSSGFNNFERFTLGYV